MLLDVLYIDVPGDFVIGKLMKGGSVGVLAVVVGLAWAVFSLSGGALWSL